MDIDFSDNFWVGVGLASVVATAFSTLLALVFSMWWRFVDHRSAAWILYGGSSAWHGHDPYSNLTHVPRAIAQIANSGAGSAFEVRVCGLGCRAQLESGEATRLGSRIIPLIPVLRSGELSHLVVYCAPEAWAQAGVAVTWREPGVLTSRSRHRLYVPRLTEITAAPSGESLHESERANSLAVLKNSFPPDHAQLSNCLFLRLAQLWKLRFGWLGKRSQN